MVSGRRKHALLRGSPCSTKYLRWSKSPWSACQKRGGARQGRGSGRWRQSDLTKADRLLLRSAQGLRDTEAPGYFDALPHNPFGKVLKRVLRSELGASA